MKSTMLGCIGAAALGAAIVSATPALAFRGGGFGGMHGGFGGGGMHFGGGAMHFGGGMPFGGGGFRGGMVTGRSLFVPGAGRFAGAPFAWGWGWPYYGYGYNGCWQQVWTGYGWQWINACYNYGY